MDLFSFSKDFLGGLKAKLLPSAPTPARNLVNQAAALREAVPITVLPTMGKSSPFNVPRQSNASPFNVRNERVLDLQPIKNLAADILRAPLRAASSEALTVKQFLEGGGPQQYTPGEGPAPRLEKFLFGDRPVKDIASSGGRLGPAGGAVGFLLDLTPVVGGERKAAQDVAESTISGYLKSKVSTTVGKEAKEGFLTSLYTKLVDRFNPINKVARIAEDLPVKPLPGENPYSLARRYLGVKGIAESKLYWKTTDLNPDGTLAITGEGLQAVLNGVKGHEDSLRALLVAEREVELAKRAEQGLEAVKGVDGKQAQGVIDALKVKYGDQFANLKVAAQGTRDYARRAVLDPLRSVGRISDDEYRAILKDNEFFTPFNRVLDEVANAGSVPSANRIFQPVGNPVQRLKGSERQIIDPMESLVRNTYRGTDFIERARVAQAVARLSKVEGLGEVIRRVDREGANTIKAWEDGKPVWYQVPADLAKAMSSLSEGDMGLAMRILSFPTRVLRAGATLSLEFIARNPLRDQFSAFVYSKYGYTPGVDLVKGIFETVGKDEVYQKWLASGGAQSMFVSLDRLSTMKELQDVIGTSKVSRAVTYLNPLKALQALSEFSEKSTRVGAFGNALKKGATEIEAALESRELTLDFARRGQSTKALNQMIAFWNADVLGIDKLARSMVERPLQTSMKAVMGITVPSIGLYLANRDNPRYLELPQWEKDLFWIVMPGGEKGPIFRIPKPFELGIVFGTLPEHLLSWVDKNDPEALRSIVGALESVGLPGYMPTALLPVVENMANYSFFRDRPIVGQALSGLPAEMQTNPYTTETAKEIGHLLKVSPLKVENVVRGYFAGLGSYALSVSDEMLQVAGVTTPPPAPTPELSDLPLVKAFVAREPIGSEAESVNKFYTALEKAAEAKAGVEALMQAGKEKQAVAYLRDHKEAVFANDLGKIAKKLAEIRKRRNAVLLSEELDPQKKRHLIDALDKLTSELARNVLTVIESSK